MMESTDMPSRRRARWYYYCCLYCLGGPWAVGASTEGQDEQPLCSLYMAESSNSRSGWGVYTGVDIPRGHLVEPRDVALPLMDAPLPLGLLAEYVTKSDEIALNREAHDVLVLLPGNGMLGNSHPGLDNIEIADHDECVVQKLPAVPRNHPAVGSSSHYHGVCFKTRRAVSAGSELFAVYGDDWYKDRQDMFPNVALSNDYVQADLLLYKYEYLVDRSFDTPLAWELWDVVLHVLQDLRPNLLTILPDEASEVEKILQAYGDDFRLTTAKASQPNHQRSPEWLQEHGFCMDNLQPRKTATDKGWGAFAKRDLSQGTIVAPLPLLHLHREILQVEWKDLVTTLWKGQQLLLNYCFGHPQSTVLLFPYSTAVGYINHGRPANVALRWSDRMTRPERLHEPAENLHADHLESGLLLELVALRDIDEGEEILLDYGDEWVAAWQAHVADWSPPTQPETYQSAEEYRALLAANGDTIENFDYDSLLGNVDVFCLFSFETVDQTAIYIHNPLAPLEHCRIVGSGLNHTFRVQYFLTHHQGIGEESTFVYDSLPLDAMQFYDKDYTSDFHLRHAFRHEIGLPSNIFPDAWKDMREEPSGKKGYGHSTVDRMNRRVEWIRTTVELKSKPYPKGIRTACLLYVDLEMVATDATSIKWVFNRTWASPGEFSCDINARHFDEEIHYDEIVARAESVMPLAVYFNATLWLPRRTLNVTGIPRSAIRFR